MNGWQLPYTHRSLVPGRKCTAKLEPSKLKISPLSIRPFSSNLSTKHRSMRYYRIGYSYVLTLEIEKSRYTSACPHKGALLGWQGGHPHAGSPRSICLHMTARLTLRYHHEPQRPTRISHPSSAQQPIAFSIRRFDGWLFYLHIIQALQTTMFSICSATVPLWQLHTLPVGISLPFHHRS